jgi:hypothetical protein
MEDVTRVGSIISECGRNCLAAIIEETLLQQILDHLRAQFDKLSQHDILWFEIFLSVNI